MQFEYGLKDGFGWDRVEPDIRIGFRQATETSVFGHRRSDSSSQRGYRCRK